MPEHVSTLSMANPDMWIGPIRIVWGGTYYWCVDGPLPIAIANELYEDPLGRTSVRVGGDCGCPPPETYTRWYSPGGALVITTERAARFVNDPHWRDIVESVLSPYIVHDAPSEIARAYVPTYHIDRGPGRDDSALELFVRVLRKHGLDSVKRPAWWDERVH